MAKVAGGGNNTFANKAADFERLTLERAFADRQVASALASLEAARNEARRKQLYLERIVQPNLPDYALEPRRARNVLATFILGLVAFGVMSMLLSGVKEHQA
jgi:capsular polysaccharide transport system permease protein